MAKLFANSGDPDQRRILRRLIWVSTVCLPFYRSPDYNGLRDKIPDHVLFVPYFLMTDSICHSSLPRMALEKVTLTTIQFCIYLRTKVDPMFQCVYISTPLKRCPYKSSATCLIYGESC